MRIGWQGGPLERKNGVAGSTARVVQAAAVDVELHLLPLIAQQVSGIGCGAGQSPRRHGAAKMRARAARQVRGVARDEFGGQAAKKLLEDGRPVRFSRKL